EEGSDILLSFQNEFGSALVGRNCRAACRESRPISSTGYGWAIRPASERPSDRKRRTPVVFRLTGRGILAVEAIEQRQADVEVADDLSLGRSARLEANAPALGETRVDRERRAQRDLWEVVHEVGVFSADHRLGVVLALSLDGLLVVYRDADVGREQRLVRLNEIAAAAHGTKHAQIES